MLPITSASIASREGSTEGETCVNPCYYKQYAPSKRLSLEIVYQCYKPDVKDIMIILEIRNECTKKKKNILNPKSNIPRAVAS